MYIVLFVPYLCSKDKAYCKKNWQNWFSFLVNYCIKGTINCIFLNDVFVKDLHLAAETRAGFSKRAVAQISVSQITFSGFSPLNSGTKLSSLRGCFKENFTFRVVIALLGLLISCIIHKEYIYFWIYIISFESNS